MSACEQSGCGGTVASDGYCDTCGMAPRKTEVVAAPTVCSDPACGGSVLADGYCDTCGLHGAASAPTSSAVATSARPSGVTSSSTTASATIAAPVSPTTSTRVSRSAEPESSRRSDLSSTRRRVAQLGAGLVNIAPVAQGDPARAVMSADKIASVLGQKPEEERFCSSCGRPVGRGNDGESGRVTGFCGTCRTPFDFVTNAPTLAAGELVGGQYEILGPIAHGGMGWIYLGKDQAVSNRWVVLKGLLNEDDPDMVASAVAERQFLARIEHGSIVNIYNFVTWAGRGYIVMEFVGGESLNSILKDRRQDNAGTPNPMPATQAIAYLLGVLPALGYLHGLGLVYNDLKPANIMAVQDTVKLIDVGGVMQADDASAAIFGTQGFQAPEVASMGPSIASDLYTVGRTLAVLSLNFRYHDGQFLHSLPSPQDEPLFDEWESLYRFLLKATAPHPDDRFQSADAMAVQLVGVLREIVAMQTGDSRPTPSELFGGDRLARLLLAHDDIDGPDWRVLPYPRYDDQDLGSALLESLPDGPDALVLLESGLDSGSVELTREIDLRRIRERLLSGEDPSKDLVRLETQDPWDWRVRWYRSVQQLRDGAPVAAAEGFSAVWTELPGELAPKLGVAVAAEAAGEYARAGDVYEEVVAVDASYVAAAFGLARCRAQVGDRRGAVDAYRSVPASSSTYTEAQVASARLLAGGGSDPKEVIDAAALIEGARLDAAARSVLAVDVLESALTAIESKAMPEQSDARIFGQPFTERGLRRGLDTAYRDLARVTSDADERVRLIDAANRIRVRTLV